jgi:D-beta-D-heptose 7-phosphate kinase/D-beta-D-heptose 1-phosphate adenosyltransferase
MSQTLGEALDRLPGLRLAVVGDLMLDRFVFGQIDRISPEAPVPVVHVRDEESRLGGAGNVARNAASLGLGRVDLVGCVGTGELGDELLGLLADDGISIDQVVRSDARLTTVKTRILGGGQQVVRIDRESSGPMEETLRRQIVGAVEALDCDVIIVSDYAKGVIDEAVMEVLRAKQAAGTPVVCDPKQGDFSLYRQTACITPNAREAGSAEHAVVEDDDSAERVASQLRARLGTQMILLTRGEQGMTLLGEDIVHLSTEATHVYDVTGAGDTVIATFSALLGAGAPSELAARAANAAAGLVIRELGTATITSGELRGVLGA